MAQDKNLMPASIVTPLKMQQTHRKVQPRLLNRALGLAPSSNGDNSFPAMSQQHQVEDPKSGLAQEQPPASQSRRSDRVFRCLSNTGAKSTSGNSLSRAQAQQSALKSMFRPPASKPTTLMMPSPRRSKEQDRQAQVPARSSVFLDSSLSSKILRSTSADNKIGEPVQSQKKVQFKPTVAIAWIPSHRAYPSKIKRALWGSMKEIKANAIRNTAEYIYEKCNWRKSTEEDQFYRDTRSGTLIHPVHVQRYYAAMKKMQEEQAKKRAQEEQAELERCQEDSSSDSDEERSQVQESERISRKRVRCCTPSPIRRSHLDNSTDYDYDYSYEPAPKRYRASMECHSPTYYSPHHQMSVHSHYPMQQQQQENYYVYYEHQPEPYQGMMPMQQPPYPFPNQSFPPAEIA